MIDEKCALDDSSSCSKSDIGHSGHVTYANTDTDAANSSAHRVVPFQLWRARFLVGQELLCCICVFLATNYIFLHTTRPALCAIGPQTAIERAYAAAEQFYAAETNPWEQFTELNYADSRNSCSSSAVCNATLAPGAPDVAAVAATAATHRTLHNSRESWPLAWQLLCHKVGSSSTGSDEDGIYQILPGFQVVQYLKIYTQNCAEQSTATSNSHSAAVLWCGCAQLLLAVLLRVANAAVNIAQVCHCPWSCFVKKCYKSKSKCSRKKNVVCCYSSNPTCCCLSRWVCIRGSHQVM